MTVLSLRRAVDGGVELLREGGRPRNGLPQSKGFAPPLDNGPERIGGGSYAGRSFFARWVRMRERTSMPRKMAVMPAAAAGMLEACLGRRENLP